MKALQQLVVAACLTLAPRAASAQAYVWYDAARQAIAVDAYADGARPEGAALPSIDVDFDENHDFGATVWRSDWSAQSGAVTAPGLFETRALYCGGTTWTAVGTWYGWADRLGALTPATAYASDARFLEAFPWVRATERFHYFTDAWDVASGRTVVYVRPLDAANAPVPVVPNGSAVAWYRIGLGPWLPVTSGETAPPPEVASMQIAPRTLNLRSKGQAVTVKLALPAGRAAEEVDVDSLRLGVTMEQRETGGALLHVVRHSSGPLAVVYDAGLVVKFSRSDLQGLVFPGEAALTLTGTFDDGARFEAKGTITFLP